MICGNDVMDRVCADGQTFDQRENFIDRFLTGCEDFVLRARLVSARVDLVVVDIDHVLTSKDFSQFGNLHGLNIVKLDTPAVRLCHLQNCFALLEIVSLLAVYGNVEIWADCNRFMRQQRRHAEPRIGRQNRLHCRDRCGAFLVCLNLLKECPPDLISQRIRNDNDCTFFVIANKAGIKIKLLWQSALSVSRCKTLIPVDDLLVQIVVGIDVLYQIAQSFKVRAAFQPVKIEVEVPIAAVDEIILRCVLLDNIFNTRDRKIESGSHDVKCVLKDEILAAEPLPKVHLTPQCADLWNCLSTELGIEVFAL